MVIGNLHLRLLGDIFAALPDAVFQDIATRDHLQVRARLKKVHDRPVPPAAAPNKTGLQGRPSGALSMNFRGG